MNYLLYKLDLGGGTLLSSVIISCDHHSYHSLSQLSTVVPPWWCAAPLENKNETEVLPCIVSLFNSRVVEEKFIFLLVHLH